MATAPCWPKRRRWCCSPERLGVDLKGSNLRLANRTDRAQFRASVEVLHNPPGLQPCAGVAATVEIFDATGRTSIVVAHPQQF